MIVDVTQYMRPDGRQVQHKLTVSNECKEKYDELVSCGARLTGEQLMSRTVSQCIEMPDFDYDMELTDGDDLKENIKALEKMILRFDKVECMKQKEALCQN